MKKAPAKSPVPQPIRRSLVVLTADLDMENAVKGILTRGKALGIRELVEDTDVQFVRPFNRDAGCYKTADSFLRMFCLQYEHALVFFDRDGSGREELTAEAIESDVEGRLSRNGWENRARAIVIDPELEAWVWSPSPNVDLELGWRNHDPSLRDWLVEEGFLSPKQVKPRHPKEAMERALRHVGVSRSASIYYNLARKVSLAHCTDRAFLKFKNTLTEWFGEL